MAVRLAISGFGPVVEIRSACAGELELPNQDLVDISLADMVFSRIAVGD